MEGVCGREKRSQNGRLNNLGEKFKKKKRSEEKIVRGSDSGGRVRQSGCQSEGIQKNLE